MGKHKPPSGPDAERDYQLGYRKPPIEHRFQKGDGGNRKGRRPTTAKVTKTAGETIANVLSRKVAVKRGTKSARISVEEVIVEKLVAKALSGDRLSAAMLIKLRMDNPGSGDAPAEAAINPEDLQILQLVQRDIAAGNKIFNEDRIDGDRRYKDPTQ